MSASSKKIAIVDYGMGNIHSIVKAVRLFAPNSEYTPDPEAIASADAVVLPGDGAFGAAMAGLAGAKEAALREAVSAGKPLLGICIGFQVLFQDSDETFGDGVPTENGVIRGLDLLEGHVRHFAFDDTSLAIPHMGWNRLHPAADEADTYYQDYMYFVHSCRAVDVPDATVVARCEYGGERFPAVVRRDNLLATQFHPEKSGGLGLKLLRDWCESL